VIPHTGRGNGKCTNPASQTVKTEISNWMVLVSVSESNLKFLFSQ
jgi:hypothetical protein